MTWSLSNRPTMSQMKSGSTLRSNVPLGTPDACGAISRPFSARGRRILFAWNGSREAARAVHGALPFIEKAERVDLYLGRGKETFRSITRYPELKITDYLRRRTPRIEARRFDGLTPKRERPCSTRRGRLARTWWSWEHTVDRGSANGFWAAQHGRSCAKCMFRF